MNTAFGTLQATPLLKTDAYEFTMLSTLADEGRADDHAVCELFARNLPKGRRFAIQAGLGRALQDLEAYQVTDAEVTMLEDLKILGKAGAAWLRERVGGPMFRGTLRAYREGDFYNPFSPIVQVEGKLGELILLETFLLSIYNHDSAIATTAARMVTAAKGKRLIEMGSRRTEDNAALSVARASYVAGFDATSNVAAAIMYGIPTTGTAAHAFTLAHESEFEAFKAQLATWGVLESTLLVDTYDTRNGIALAVEAAKSFGFTGPGGIRIDSGDLVEETRKARAQLDELGAFDTKIVLSSDIDEYMLETLAPEPVDGFGVGTKLVTGGGRTAGMVYKLVEVNGRPVAKKSQDKMSVGGKKTSYRLPDGSERYSLDGTVRGFPLQEVFIEGGRVVNCPTLDETRRLVRTQLEELPETVKDLTDGIPWQVAELE